MVDHHEQGFVSYRNGLVTAFWLKGPRFYEIYPLGEEGLFLGYDLGVDYVYPPLEYQA